MLASSVFLLRYFKIDSSILVFYPVQNSFLLALALSLYFSFLENVQSLAPVDNGTIEQKMERDKSGQ